MMGFRLRLNTGADKGGGGGGGGVGGVTLLQLDFIVM